MRLRTLLLNSALVALGVLPVACGGDDDPATTVAAPPATTSTASADPAEADEGGSTPNPAATELYFTSGEQFRAVERNLPRDGSELRSAAEAVIAGPTAAERSAKVEAQTAIPSETEVEDVTLGADGVAVVDVSPEFTAGIPASPSARTRDEESELNARLGQVTFTLTQFPQVKEAKVVAGGEPVAQTALDRSDYAKPAQGPRRLDRPQGERGSSVRKLQARLAELRYLPGRAVDGVAGYQTTQAVIAFQSWRGLERDGIVGPQTSAALAKASPPTPKGDGPSRRIEVYRAQGVALLIANDEVRRAIHISAGAPGTETPAGTYTVFRKELRSWSVPFQTWLPYASYFNAGIAFHEYPDVPTFPASHGCVRVPAPEAKGVYRFTTIDTTVVVR